MIISNITPPQVWSASSRSLTNFGSGALTPADTLKTSVAASGSVDLRTSAGIVGMATIAVATGATATTNMNIQVLGGPDHFQLVATANAANSFAGFTMVNTNSVGASVFNADAAQAGSYMVAQYLMTI